MNRNSLAEAFTALVSSLTDGFAAFRDSIGDEFVTRGWFQRNPTPGGGHANSLASNPGTERTEPGLSSQSFAITHGWEIAKEPSHDRGGPGHDIDR